MKGLISVLLLMLVACDGGSPVPVEGGAGARLEAAAVAEGLVVDAATASLAGSWGRDTDRLCVVGTEGGAQRLGARIDYGEGQGCSAGGTLRRAGARLAVDFGRGCSFDARFDGERIAFPAELPTACEARCSGRASLAALEVDRLSGAASEASTLRGSDGAYLCRG